LDTLTASAGTPLKNIGIIDANISGQGSVGGLCGYITLATSTSTSTASINIDNCYVKNSKIQASKGFVGGLIGYAGLCIYIKLLC
jgi:hypothetical protein